MLPCLCHYVSGHQGIPRGRAGSQEADHFIVQFEARAGAGDTLACCSRDVDCDYGLPSQVWEWAGYKAMWTCKDCWVAVPMRSPAPYLRDSTQQYMLWTAGGALLHTIRV